MSGFVHGLVARSAGLATRASPPRPALHFVPVPDTALEPPLEAAEPSTEEQGLEERSAAPVTGVGTRTSGAGAVVTVAAPPAGAATEAALPQAPASAPPAPEPRDPADREVISTVREIRTESPRPVVAPPVPDVPRQTELPAPPPAPAPEATQPSAPPPSATVSPSPAARAEQEAPPEESRTTKRVERTVASEPAPRPIPADQPPAAERPPAPQLLPAYHEPPPQVPREEHAEPPVEVHIGRVEVRPHRPEPPPRQRPLAPRAARNFDDLALARRGLDRRWY
jgi:hypothetical protein